MSDPMNFAVVLDALERLEPSGDSSIALMEAAQALGHVCYVTEARDLTIADGRAVAPVRRVHVAAGRMEGPRWLAQDPWYRLEEPGTLTPLASFDAVLFRTDPPFDRRYLWATWLLDAVDRDRTIMVNDPRGLREANEKLFPLRYPELIPPTLVTADLRLVRRFVDEHGAAVAKPIDGHAGRGVLRLAAGDPNLASIVEIMTARGTQPLVVQAWLAASSCGSKRVVVYGGEILGAVARRVEPSDFRTGNPSGVAEVTDRDREIVVRLRPALDELGLRLVGLDVIGGDLIEVNVTSPGGIRQAEGLGLAGISRMVIERIEAERRRQRT